MRLEELTPGARVSGILPEDVRIIAVHPVGDSAVEVTFKDADGQVGQQLLYRTDQAKLDLATASGPTFDGDGAAFRVNACGRTLRTWPSRFAKATGSSCSGGFGSAPGRP